MAGRSTALFCRPRIRLILLGPTVAVTSTLLTLVQSGFVIQTRPTSGLPATRNQFAFPPVVYNSCVEESKNPALMGKFRCAATKTESIGNTPMDGEVEEGWFGLLPFEEGSHRSARIHIDKFNVDENDLFCRDSFQERLEATIDACRELNKSSLWIDIHMSRASLIEDMMGLGLRFHHAEGETATLNMWLPDSESKIPEYATHHIGVGAFVLNSRQEVLCVRELRKNYRPWKIPGGLAELGEQINEAAEREVLEETGVRTVFHSILGFRHTHGMANGRSDLYFICRLDPIEGTDEDTGNSIIPTPVAQESEIEKVEWVPLSKYREMVTEYDGGHPVMKLILKILDGCDGIEKTVLNSVVPGRSPSPLYHPQIKSVDDGDSTCD